MEINFGAVIDKICRTCLGESNQMKPLQCKINGERTLLELVEETTNTTILMSNKLPQNICNECEDIICKSDAFKRNCIDTQRMLSEIVNGHKNTQNVVKIEIESGINAEVQNPYHCNVCSEKFPFIQNLIAHTMIHSKDEKKLKTEGTQLSFKDNLVSAIDIEIDPKFKLEKIEDTEKDFDNMDYDNDNSDLPSPSFSVPIVDEKPNQPKEKLKTCVCGKKLTKKVSYKAHLKKCLALQSEVYETEVKDIACMQCDMVFDTLNQFKNHLNKHKNEVVSVSTPKQLYQCSMCMRKFIRKSSLDLHLQKHNKNDNVKHTCTHCKREFKHRAHLETHILIVHTRENGFACDICARQFSTKETLEIHKEGHNVKKLHKCDRCDKSFYMLSTLTDHIRSHTGEKPFLCSICGKGFSQKNNLGQHMRRHLGLKPFRCTECEKSFVSKGELEGHTRKHSGAHPFVCDECGNAFTTSSSLVKHRRTHTGERPYACDLCPMKFAASGTLTNHRRTHTGEKPFQCSYCDKAFVQRQDLVAHIRCHTGERPFVCNSCGQAFRKATGLKAHVKMHLKEPVKEGMMHGGGMLGGLS